MERSLSHLVRMALSVVKIKRVLAEASPKIICSRYGRVRAGHGAGAGCRDAEPL